MSAGPSWSRLLLAAITSAASPAAGAAEVAAPDDDAVFAACPDDDPVDDILSGAVVGAASCEPALHGLMLGHWTWRGPKSTAGRLEVGPTVGVLRTASRGSRAAVGGSLGLHFSEVFSFDLAGSVSLSPWAGETEWVPMHHGFPTRIAGFTIAWHADATARFVIAKGKAGFRRYGIFDFHAYPLLGFGVASTRDDVEGLQCAMVEGSACADAYQQVHPTLSLGGGVRVWLSYTTALRLEARALPFVENLGGNHLAPSRAAQAHVGVTWAPRVIGRRPARRDSATP